MKNSTKLVMSLLLLLGIAALGFGYPRTVLFEEYTSTT